MRISISVLVALLCTLLVGAFAPGANAQPTPVVPVVSTPQSPFQLFVGTYESAGAVKLRFGLAKGGLTVEEYYYKGTALPVVGISAVETGYPTVPFKIVLVVDGSSIQRGQIRHEWDADAAGKNLRGKVIVGDWTGKSDLDRK